MNTSRPRLRLGLFALAAVLLSLASCEDKSLATYVEGLRSTESLLRPDEKEKSVEELQRDVARYKADVERAVKATENLGTAYRMLALAYMNRQMYGEALPNLESAIQIYPENEQLTYYGGVCAARMAKAQTDDAERARLLTLSEKYYQRTLFLYPDYQPALLGLAVIYSIEMNRPAEAVPLLERALAKDVNNMEAMMLLARTHVSLANYEEALVLYRRIASAATDAATKQQVQANITEIEGRLQAGTTP
jgi:tetratricopeptide (TPR) repeat protein